MKERVTLTKRGRFVGHLFTLVVSCGIVFSIPLDWYFPGATAIFVVAVILGFTIFYNVEIRYPYSNLFEHD